MNRSILLTGTIDPGVYSNTGVVLTDAGQRLEQYEEAISFYIKESKLKKIIFVENSGFPFDENRFVSMAEKYDKSFEFIPIKTDYQKTLDLGKSYGEADCMCRGVELSQLLQDEECFFKVTGRVIIRNIDKLMDDTLESAFVVRNDTHRCITSFFKVNKADFIHFFMQSVSMCNEREGNDIETVFWKIINKNKMTLRNFDRFPVFDGVYGTSGGRYNDSKLELLIKNIFLKTGAFSAYKYPFVLGTFTRIRIWMADKKERRLLK